MAIDALSGVYCSEMLIVTLTLLEGTVLDGIKNNWQKDEQPKLEIQQIEVGMDFNLIWNRSITKEG